jgi:hypothetical protein
MTLDDDDRSDPPHPCAHAIDPADASTGLTWPRTWPGVYMLVFGCFVAWVALLLVLERSFS